MVCVPIVLKFRGKCLYLHIVFISSVDVFVLCLVEKRGIFHECWSGVENVVEHGIFCYLCMCHMIKFI